MIDLNEIGEESRKIKVDKGFWVVWKEDWENRPERILSKITFIHGELAEAVDEVVKGTKEKCIVELADVIIRTSELLRGLGADINEVIKRKVEYNRNRAKKHGGKRMN